MVSRTTSVALRGFPSSSLGSNLRLSSGRQHTSLRRFAANLLIGAPGLSCGRLRRSSLVSRTTTLTLRDYLLRRSARTSSSLPGADTRTAPLRGEPTYRGARIRTGDLCDPNAALYRTEPRPGLLGYTTDGVGWTSLRDRRLARHPIGRFANTRSLARLEPRSKPLRSSRGFEPTFNSVLPSLRTGWDSNPRGREPTRFPIVRLKPLGHPSNKRPRTGLAHDHLLLRNREWDGRHS